MKWTVRIAITLLLTLGFLALFLRAFDLGAAWRHLQGASLTLIGASVVLNLAAYLVRAWRWRHLLAPIRARVGMYNLTSTTLIGFMVSFIVPMRIGEIVRPVLLARRERLSATSAIATIALERLFDALTVMVLFLVFALTPHGIALLAAPSVETGTSQAGILLRRGAMVATGLVVVGLPLVALLVAFPAQLVGWLHRLSSRARSRLIARVAGLMERFLEGLSAVRRGKEMLACASLSLLMWLVIDLSVYMALRAFDLEMRFLDTFLFMVPLATGIAVPTPGGVGPYEFLAQISLTDFWGVTPAAAAALAVTLHAITIVPVVAIGVLFMWRDGIRPTEVRGIVSAGAMPARGGEA